MDVSPDTMLGLVNKMAEDEGEDFSPTEPNGDQEDETLLATDPVQQNQVQPITAHREDTLPP